MRTDNLVPRAFSLFFLIRRGGKRKKGKKSWERGWRTDKLTERSKKVKIVVVVFNRLGNYEEESVDESAAEGNKTDQNGLTTPGPSGNSSFGGELDSTDIPFFGTQSEDPTTADVVTTQPEDD